MNTPEYLVAQPIMPGETLIFTVPDACPYDMDYLFTPESLPELGPDNTVIIEDENGYDYRIYGAPLEDNCFGPDHGDGYQRTLRDYDIERAHTVALLVDEAETAIVGARKIIRESGETTAAIEAKESDETWVMGCSDWRLNAEAFAKTRRAEWVIETASTIVGNRYHEAMRLYREDGAPHIHADSEAVQFAKHYDRVDIGHTRRSAERNIRSWA
jgi:hypothetical protein